MNDQQKKILIALKKSRTSLERIIDRIESTNNSEKDTCFNLIQQNLAVIGLLKSANILMLEEHMRKILQDTDAQSPEELQRAREEIVRIVTLAQNK